MASLRAPGTPVTLRGVGARVFWAYPTIVVEDTASLVGLYLPAGAVGKDAEPRPLPREFFAPETMMVVDCTWERTDVLMLIVPGEAFSTYLMWKTGTQDLDCWYINLQEPLRRTTIGFDTMDQMLDIVLSPDMADWLWKDEDEFLEAERIGFYSHAKAREIRQQGERALQLLTRERRAFYEKWKSWFADPVWRVPSLSSLWDRLDWS